MSNVKDDFMKIAMKAMQNEKVQKIMANEKVQESFANAFKASYELKSQFEEKKQELAERLNLATKDDLRSMKRELDRLQRQVSRLKRQKREAEKRAREAAESDQED
mgnify:CR=1 FL=1